VVFELLVSGADRDEKPGCHDLRIQLTRLRAAEGRIRPLVSLDTIDGELITADAEVRRRGLDGGVDNFGWIRLRV